MNALDPFARREVWVTWAIVKRHGKPTKLPYSIDGKPASAADASSWMTRAQALKAAKQNQHQGIGIMLAALDEGRHLGGIDLDACVDEDGNVTPWGREILDLVPSYTEISPSGRGLKVYFIHDPRETQEPAKEWRCGVRLPGDHCGIELYLEGRYFAVTGKTFEDRDEVKSVTLDRLQAVQAKMEALQPQPKPTVQTVSAHPRRYSSDDELLFDAIDHISNHDLHWEEFNRIGMAIWAATNGSEQGHAAFEAFSARSTLHDPRVVAERWTNYGRSRPNRLGAGTLFHEAGRAGWRDPRHERIAKAKPNGFDVPRREAAGDPRFMESGTVLGMQLPARQWIVEGLVPEGLSVLAGKPKVGKSYWALDVAMAAATGGYALGSLKCPQVDVLYLDLENGWRRIQDRIKQTRPDWQMLDLSRLQWSITAPPLSDGLIDLLDQWRSSVREPRLIVLDVLQRVKPPGLMTRNAYENDSSIWAPLHDWLLHHGISMLGLHHLRKADSDDPLDLLSGSLGLPATADAVLVLKRVPGLPPTLYVRGRDVEEKDLALRFDQGLWSIEGDAEKVRVSSQRQKIFEALADAGAPMTPNEIMVATGMRGNNVRQLLLKMAKAGDITKPSYGKYGALPVSPD